MVLDTKELQWDLVNLYPVPVPWYLYLIPEYWVLIIIIILVPVPWYLAIPQNQYFCMT